MVKNNHCKLISVDYVNNTLDQFLSRKNIKNEFGGARIWPFNAQAMDDNIKPSGVWTTTNISNENNESFNRYIVTDIQWGKDGGAM